MTGRKRRSRVRPRRFRRVGAALSVLALWLQLILSGAPGPERHAAAGNPADIAVVLDEHAFCLAAARAADGPAEDTPPPFRHDHGEDHGAGCCFWHAGPSFQAAVPLAFAPVLFAATTISVVAAYPQTRAQLRAGTIGARAPPPRAGIILA